MRRSGKYARIRSLRSKSTATGPAMEQIMVRLTCPNPPIHYLNMSAQRNPLSWIGYFRLRKSSGNLCEELPKEPEDETGVVLEVAHC